MSLTPGMVREPVARGSQELPVRRKPASRFRHLTRVRVGLQARRVPCQRRPVIKHVPRLLAVLLFTILGWAAKSDNFWA
jgi:hypothetical protein